LEKFKYLGVIWCEWWKARCRTWHLIGKSKCYNANFAIFGCYQV